MPKRLIAATSLAAVLFTVIVAVAAAQWPNSCVNANDAFESWLGNNHNVGIYQKTFGDAIAAEQACRNDHLNDTRAAFAWALVKHPVPLAHAPSAIDTVFVLKDVEGNVFIGFNYPKDGTLPVLGVVSTIYGATSFTENVHYKKEVPVGAPAFRIPIARFNSGRHVFVISAFNSGGIGLPTYRGFVVTTDGRIVPF